jgi:hypothetical protein
MPYHVSWLYATKVVLISFSGVLTANGISDESSITLQMIAEGTAPVHVVVDFLAVDKVALSLLDLKRISAPSETNVGWTIFVGTNPVVKFFASVIIQILHTRYAFLNTLEDAVSFLQSRDIALRDAVLPADTLPNAEAQRDSPLP